MTSAKSEKSKLRPVLREMLESDLSLILALERQIFSDAWPRSAFEDILSDENWHATVAISDDVIIGYACILIVAGELHLANLAVDPLWRRKSVAKGLLDHILQQAEQGACDSVILEVRPSNAAAKKFYEQAGFIDLYRRPNYYQQPLEDALVMIKHLSKHLGQD